MVDSRFLITLSRHPRPSGPAMAAGAPAAAPSASTHQPNRSKKPVGTPQKTPGSCHRSYGAAADAAILLAVLFAFGFLSLPWLQLFYSGLLGLGAAVFRELRDDPWGVPMALFLLSALAFFLLTLAALGIVRRGAGRRKCDSPGCRGLRNAPEFDVRVETEDQVKRSSCPDGRDGSGRLFFELSEGHHRDLEAELKKLAPPNGRAVLLFQEKCGCAVGRMVVSGPKKARKAKR